MGRRILNRKDLRADFEAAERRKADDDEEVEEEEEGDEEESDEEEEGEPSSDEEAADEAEGDEEAEEEVAPKKKKKKVVKEPKPKAKSRTRTPKVVRMKQVWGVFNNSNQRVAVYEYPKRKEADEHAARLSGAGKGMHFVQPVKEPMEEKKE